MKVMKKLIWVIIFLISCNIHVSAQTAKELASNLRRRAEIIQDPERICAEGSGEDYDDAYNDALRKLAFQIYSHVESETSDKLQYKSVNGDIVEETSFTSDFKSTTNLNIHGHHTLTIDIPNKKNREYTVFVYIDKKKAEKLVAEQKKAEEEARLRAEAEEEEKTRLREEKLNNDVNFYYTEGLHSLEKLRIGTALKDFYSGYIISSGTHATINRNGDIQPAYAVFTHLLDETLDNIKVICEVEDEEKLDKRQTIYLKQIGFYYRDSVNVYNKLDGLEFKYNDGNKYINGARVRDGISTAELRRDLNHFDLFCIYQLDENELEPIVQDALESKQIKSLDLISAHKVVQCHQETATIVLDGETAKFAEEVNPIQTLDIEYDEDRFDILTDIMIDIENAIRAKNYNSVKHYFTENGLDCFTKLIDYGNASIIEVPSKYDFINFGDIVICRSITMEFKFKNNKKFVENVTFRFDEDNKVESLAFTLTDIAQHDILDNEDWSRNSKITLLNFMEDYQTAYALGRIDYLEQIFSDNALIISGYKVMKKDKGDGYRFRSHTQLDTLSKSQYMARLRRHFATKEYINLNFTETDFTQAAGVNDFFGVRLRQEYYSSNYGDVGYLFLLVDLRKDDPVIHVRAWQEDKLPLKQLISLKNFRH